MSPMIDRLAELVRHLQHLDAIRPRVRGPEDLDPGAVYFGVS